MSKLDERPKASEVFAHTNSLFSRKVPFEEAFPTIADFRVEVVGESADGVGEKERSVFTRSNPCGEFVDCTNPLCYKGGVSIGQLLREMVRQGKTLLEDTAICRGYKGSPKGRRNYGKCLRSFKIRIEVTYQASAARNSPAA